MAGAALAGAGTAGLAAVPLPAAVADVAPAIARQIPGDLDQGERHDARSRAEALGSLLTVEYSGAFRETEIRLLVRDVMGDLERDPLQSAARLPTTAEMICRRELTDRLALVGRTSRAPRTARGA